LRYTIFDEAERAVESGAFRNQPRNKKIIIKWDCQDTKPGKYLLRIEYILKNGRSVPGQNLYEFYHTNDLGEEGE